MESIKVIQNPLKSFRSSLKMRCILPNRAWKTDGVKLPRRSMSSFIALLASSVSSRATTIRARSALASRHATQGDMQGLEVHLFALGPQLLVLLLPLKGCFHALPGSQSDAKEHGEEGNSRIPHGSQEMLNVSKKQSKIIQNPLAKARFVQV